MSTDSIAWQVQISRMMNNWKAFAQVGVGVHDVRILHEGILQRAAPKAPAFCAHACTGRYVWSKGGLYRHHLCGSTAGKSYTERIGLACSARR